MTAIEILDRCREMEGIRQEARQRIARYRDSAARVTASYGEHIGGGSTGDGDRMASVAARIDEAERRLAAREREYTAEISAACRLLDELPEVEAKLLDAYYIKGATVSGAAKLLGYSYGYARTLKGRAMAHLSNVPEATVNGLLPDWYPGRGSHGG